MFASIPEILDELRAGKIIILVDDEDRENEGDFVVAAEKVTPEAINFMITHGRGLVCLAMTGERLDELGIPPMTAQNRSRFGTAFHVSIEAAEGVSTGISAYDRARTVQVAIDPNTKPRELVQPGHIFPLRARTGGVLVRAGQTEGSVDLARIAGMNPAAVICEVINADGTMARVPQLAKIAEEFGLKMCSVESIIQWRRRNEQLVHRAARTRLQTEYGAFDLIAYENDVDVREHVALVKGDVATEEPVLVRVHSECLTGDVFASMRCDCGSQLHEAMRMIEQEGRGVVVYMRQEGRGIGLMNKIRAYELQDNGMDTVEANVHLGFDPDPREYGIGAQILTDLGVRRMRLLTNNPIKRAGLEGYGLEVVSLVPIQIPPNEINARYLQTKRDKLGHLLS
ncbi:MAG TPA: bifunctional 3,4-dihydroxy-2-butanone-4-phosphate synthase/GTP cyclohydrolase II [Candidatus Hydrogenedentes bacterium]|nr:bifunctional 3,4-dihydroxy-2-butanone-4-phosphate synthase/GTP cyclohydrolase II [Candidatus Hydrogenedentota bacterium]